MALGMETLHGFHGCQGNSNALQWADLLPGGCCSHWKRKDNRSTTNAILCEKQLAGNVIDQWKLDPK